MFLTEKELASYLKVSTVYLYQCRKKGMPCIYLGSKVVRYSLTDVLSWFKTNRENFDQGGISSI